MPLTEILQWFSTAIRIKSKFLIILQCLVSAYLSHVISYFSLSCPSCSRQTILQHAKLFLLSLSLALPYSRKQFPQTFTWPASFHHPHLYPNVIYSEMSSLTILIKLAIITPFPLPCFIFIK